MVDGAAVAFRVTGPDGGVLYTTRDPEILSAVGAGRQTVDVLSPDLSRQLAAAVLEIAPEDLPTAADDAFEEVGYVALGVTLLAAATAGQRTWSEVTGILRGSADVFGDHPYAATFKAMQIAVSTLSGELAPALLNLAVFPAATRVPVAAIDRYWSRTRAGSLVDTARDLDELAAAKVLSRPTADSVEFHDLQHAYLTLHARPLALLHSALLDGYRALLPDTGAPDDGSPWWRLPTAEPYIPEHLVWHLRGAGERRSMAATVTDPAYLVRRIDAAGPHAAEADLACAARALPGHPGITWWQSWIARYAHILQPDAGAADSAEPSAVAPTAQAWLAADRARPDAIDPDRLAPLLPAMRLRPRWGVRPAASERVRTLAVPDRDDSAAAIAWSADNRQLAAGDLDGSNTDLGHRHRPDRPYVRSRRRVGPRPGLVPGRRVDRHGRLRPEAELLGPERRRGRPRRGHRDPGERNRLVV